MKWTTLVCAEDLAAALDDSLLRVVDARFVMGPDKDAGLRAWRESHIPGAGFVDLDRDLSDHRRPASEGRHPLPDESDFVAVLERLGITPAHQVVVYDAADGAMAAARFWWLLKLLGHARVAVLDGGFARWNALALPVQHSEEIRERTCYPGHFDRDMIAGTDEVTARLGELPGWMFDARAAERYRGEVEPLDPVAGHVPGALNRPYSNNMHAGVFRPASELRGGFLELLGPRSPTQVLLSCGSGVTACHNLLAMEHAGLPGARVYAGSWSAWTSDPSRPVATGNDA